MVKLYQINQISSSFILLACLALLPSTSQARMVVENSNSDRGINFSKSSENAFAKVYNPPIGKVLANEQIHLNIKSEGNTRSVASADVTTWNGNSWDNGVPNASLDVIINNNYIGDGFTAKDFIVSPGANFKASSIVELFGNAENQSVNTVVGTIVLKGSIPQTWKGKIQNLTINNLEGASLSGPTLLTGTLKLQVGAFYTNDNLTLVSNISGTARVAKIEPEATITGNVTVQRFITSAKPGWCFIATPVLNQSKSDWADDFFFLPNYVMIHNEGGTINSGEQINGWEYAPSNVEVGKGYRAFLNQGFFNNGAVVDNTGPIFTGSKNFTIGFSPQGYNGGGWNLISNPYPCEIDWHILSKSLVDGQIHIWNNKLGSYASYTQGTGISNLGASRFIPSGQSFFVKANSAGAALYIDEDAKPINPEASSFVRMAVDPEDVVRFTLRDGIGGSDETAVRWMAETTSGFDSYYDANKIYSAGSINVFSVTSEGYNASIQARPFNQKDSITLGYSVLGGGNYFLQIKIAPEMFQGKTWFIKDNQSGLSQDISDPDVIIPFQISNDELSSGSRFKLIGYAPFVGNQKNIENSKINLFPNPSSETVHITSGEEIVKVAVFDLSGREIVSYKNEEKFNFTLPIASLQKGVYSVKILTAKGIQNNKLVKE